MMKRNNHILFFLSSSVCFFLSLDAVIVGSKEFVSVQSIINFPAADKDNMIGNFAWMQKGFALEDATTTCTFDSVYPMSGELDFRNGTLVLNQDLVLKGLISFKSFGTMIGNGFNFNLTQATFAPVFSSTFPIFQDVIIRISSNFTLLRPFHFKGNCSVVGSDNLVTLFGNLGSIVVEPGSTLTLRGITIANVHGNNIQCVDDMGTIILDNTNLIQSDNYTFSKGRYQFVNEVDWQGTFTFLYDSASSSTIQAESILNLFGGITFSIGRKAPGATDPVQFTDKTSVLRFEDATFNVNSNGMRIITGTVEFAGNVEIDSSSTSSSTALIFGDGITAHDPLLKFDPSCSVFFNRGLKVLNINNFNTNTSPANTATLIRGSLSTLLLQKDLTINNLTIVTQPGGSTVAGGRSIFSNNNTFQLPGISTFDLTGSLNSGIIFLRGNQNLNVLNGIYPAPTIISNKGNLLFGNGFVGQPLILQNSTAELTWQLNGQMLSTMIMNGGSLNLTTDFNLGNDLIFSGSGTVHIHKNSFNLGHTDITWLTPLYIDAMKGRFAINSNVTLSNIWTFSGNCLLDLTNHYLDISNGQINIERGSTLKISNGAIVGIKGTNIKCLDNNSLLMLDSLTWLQEDIFTYTIGFLGVQNFLQLTGGEIFAYQSPKAATIWGNTVVTLDVGSTFSYDTGVSPNLLQFIDASSKFVLHNNANLHTTQQGLQLIKGRLIVEGDAAISSESVESTDVNITLGDCTSSSNDFILEITNGVQLEIAQGTLNYKNIGESSWVTTNPLSTLFMNDNTTLNLYKSMTGQGMANFGSNTMLGRAPGAMFNIAIGTGSPTFFTTLPPC